MIIAQKADNLVEFLLPGYYKIEKITPEDIIEQVDFVVNAKGFSLFKSKNISYSIRKMAKILKNLYFLVLDLLFPKRCARPASRCIPH